MGEQFGPVKSEQKVGFNCLEKETDIEQQQIRCTFHNKKEHCQQVIAK